MERLSTQWRTERIPPRFHQTMNTLIETLIKPDRLQRDLFFALLLILMKENDFVLLQKSKDDKDVINHIVQLRDKEIKIYEADLMLENFTLAPVKMIASPISDVILVNVTIPEINCNTYSVCFFKNRYIPLSILGLPDTPACLDELCTLFKDGIITPVRGAILNFYSYSSPNLTGLPSNIIFEILIMLPIRDILSMTETCSKFYGIIGDNIFWKNFALRDFPLHKNCNRNWQDFYIDIYLLEKNRARSKVIRDSNALPTIRVTDYDSRLEVIL